MSNVPVANEAPRPRGWRVWWVAARPKTLFAAAGPVVAGLGLAAAQGTLRPRVALATLVAALLLQIGVNLANDAQDYQRGADTVGERLGPPRVTALGWLTPQQVYRAAWVVFGLALLVGLYLVAVGGWPILLIGLASIVSAWAYSGGPYPLAYHGLGELFVFIFFGLIAVSGTVYLQTGTWPPGAWALGAAMGLFNTGILVVNNYRDLENDRRAGKRTLAVRLGPRRTQVEYTLTVLLPYGLVLGAVVAGWLPRGALLGLLTLPWAWRLHRAFRQRHGRALNPLLAATGKLGFAFALLTALGMVLWA